MLRARVLTAADVSAFTPLTPPAYERLVRGLDADRTVVAVGASFFDQPVGLALARVINAEGKVLSLYVLTPYRGNGIATALLSELERALRDHGCSQASMIYLAGTPTTPAIEQLLANRGWLMKGLRWLHLEGSLESIARAPWVENATLPDGLTIQPWRELSAEDRRALSASQDEETWIPPELEPKRWEKGFEPHASLALRAGEGEIVGWMICHEIEPRSIRFSSGWIRRDFQRLHRAAPFAALLAESIRRARCAGFDRGSHAVAAHQAPMLAFMQRRIAPYASSVGEAYEAEKGLA